MSHSPTFQEAAYDPLTQRIRRQYGAALVRSDTSRHTSAARSPKIRRIALMTGFGSSRHGGLERPVKRAIRDLRAVQR